MSHSKRYRIFETKQFSKDLDGIAKSLQPMIREKLAQYVYPQLGDEPHFGSQIKKLKGWQPATWRYRVGDWRFFFEIDEKSKIVFMTAAVNRKEAY